jgi:hypothetical protein
MVNRKNGASRSRFRHGDLVEVRAWNEIAATLDAEGKLEGLPFMPEMSKYCGRRLRVYRRAEGVYLDGLYYVAAIAGTVLLEDVRCDGSSHDDCRMGCLLLWKEAWLNPAGGNGQCGDAEAGRSSAAPALPLIYVGPGSAADQRFRCQATELMKATTPLPWWRPLQYVRILLGRDRSAGELLRMMLTAASNKVRWRLGIAPKDAIQGTRTRTPDVSLDLQPGELVQVKRREEIEATLDSSGRNKGLAFAPDMLRFCGGTYRVARRVPKAVNEQTGQAREIRNTVALEDVTCSGIAQRCCPRACYHLWREIWLTRASETA